MADIHHFSSFKLAGYQPFATHTFSAPQLRGHHLKEMSRTFVGPMPHQEFLEEFMPIKLDGKTCPTVRQTLFLPVVPQPLEKDMYDPFITAIKTSKVFPGFQLVKTADKPDKDGAETETKIVPDVVAYKAGFNRKDKGLTSWSKMELYIEFKRTLDPFEHPMKILSNDLDSNAANNSSNAAGPSRQKPPPPSKLPPKSSLKRHEQPLRRSSRLKKLFSAKVPASLIKKTKVPAVVDPSPVDSNVKSSTNDGKASSAKANDAKAQAATYATRICAKQHRLHLFSVIIFGTHARFMRWDRSGTIYTDKFDYHENPQVLADFFWRFSHLSSQQRGCDTTVITHDSKWVDYAKWATILKNQDVPGFSDGSDLTEMSIPLDDTPDPHYARYIVANPLSSPESPTGRGTRGYIAVDMNTKTLVFLKDYWRISDLEKEGDKIQKLNRANVPNVPQFMHHADIEGIRTITRDYVDKTWATEGNKDHLIEHVLYRLVTKDVLFPLIAFKSSRQLIRVVKDAFEAHEAAWNRCELLHRDVSAGNIMIRKDGVGILNDWDLAISKSDLSDLASKQRIGRTGTWQFMSSLLLIFPGSKVHDIQDDIESFVHVLIYTGLRYLPHNVVEQLPGIMHNLFDSQSQSPEGLVEGGHQKASNFNYQSVLTPTFLFESPPLQLFWESARLMVQQWLTYRSNELNRLSLQNKRRVPQTNSVDPSTLDLFDHTQMRKLFEELLEDASQYPAKEDIYDRLRPRSEKRKHRDVENDMGDEPHQETEGTKRKRTLKK